MDEILAALEDLNGTQHLCFRRRYEHDAIDLYYGTEWYA